MLKAEHLRHILWLFGIFVALAMREALVAIPGPFLRLEGLADLRFWWPEIGQFFLVLLTAMNFSLGCNAYYTTCYGESSGSAVPPAFAVDVGASLVHFLGIFLWALSLRLPDPLEPAQAPAPVAFFFLTLFVLLYDAAWLLGHKAAKGSEGSRIFAWTLRNELAAAVFVVVTVVVTSISSGDLRTGVGLASFIVAAWMLIDFGPSVRGAWT